MRHAGKVGQLGMMLRPTQGANRDLGDTVDRTIGKDGNDGDKATEKHCGD
jgi:hypothetical protein